MGNNVRKCTVCEVAKPDRELYQRSRDGKRRRYCSTCLPAKKNMGNNRPSNPRDLKVDPEDLRRSMKLAMLRGLAQGIFTEEETLRALEKMS
jgi:hypothetical protein